MVWPDPVLGRGPPLLTLWLWRLTFRAVSAQGTLRVMESWNSDLGLLTSPPPPAIPRQWRNWKKGTIPMKQPRLRSILSWVQVLTLALCS